jgi:branched-subunit amino acid permease
MPCHYLPVVGYVSWLDVDNGGLRSACRSSNDIRSTTFVIVTYASVEPFLAAPSRETRSARPKRYKDTRSTFACLVSS